MSNVIHFPKNNCRRTESENDSHKPTQLMMSQSLFKKIISFFSICYSIRMAIF